MNVQSALNDCVLSVDGEEYIDLISGFGSVVLGHGNPTVLKSLTDQLSQISHAGRFPTPILDHAYAALKKFVPKGHHQLSLYTGGSEAAEFAIRVATRSTNRNKILGFSNSMHGKSLATAQLGWDNEVISLPCITRLPFFFEDNEKASLETLEIALKGEEIAAVFLEPILGTAGGYQFSTQAMQEISKLCSRYGTFLVIDEILTGFRAGSPFVFQQSEISPDIIIFGKAIGNGFPVSCIALKDEINVTPEMLPGTTFSENPLAAAAIVGTLTAMDNLDLWGMIQEIQDTICSTLAELKTHGFQLRGSGALWIIEPPKELSVSEMVDEIFKKNVLMTTTRSHLRLIPAATIDLKNLRSACEIIKDVCLDFNSRK